MTTGADQMTAFVHAQHRAYLAAIEEACEQALQGGTCGVLVVRNDDGSWDIGPSGEVPYGRIHYFPLGRMSPR